ncbi:MULTISPECIES: TetR/AcrR family transcriptional regulator [unclassified Cellulomonas]|uniref:TetR/AcrR family transcriptional regulator n=1 Tax=unclassified Cellulomonas TaxID=2620175 RepID=UPI0019887E70|nr:TetR/AcrR family transcriptional regulator [Cellulomonas sp. ES6]MBD3777651.1 TetR/AcrR family transcriptional regulator [Micrococcales bacterium]WHP16641.1 TetR/AcrR family transcriptional regulator [Cellulomonas sp. ES6]
MPADGAPTRRPGGRTRRVTERLYAAAVELLAERGLDGLQYDELAARAQVGRATVYRRWPDRDGLLADVLEHFAVTSVPITDTGDVVEDLTAFVHAFAAAAASPAGRVVLQILLRRVDEDDDLRRAGVRLLDQRTADLQRRLDLATAAGQLPPVGAPFVNMMLAGPVQWSTLRRARPLSVAEARDVVELVVAGLRQTGRL